jgi:fucose 4-O-acetylase-like acetyltransferase
LALKVSTKGTANAFKDSQPSHAAGRLRAIDVAKGIGIIAVVVGHVLVGMFGYGLFKDATWPNFVIRWIHFWHMPLFVFLSGILAHRILLKSNSQFWRQSVQILILPYLLWGTLQTMASHQFSLPSSSSLASETFKLFWQPPMQFWFVYFLFVAQVSFFGLTKLSKSPWLFCVLGLAVVLILEFSGLAPRSTSMLNRFRQNLPWYIFGIIVSTSVLKLLKSTESIGKDSNTSFRVPMTLYGLGALILASINTALLVLPIYEMPHWLRVLILPVPGLLLVFCLTRLIRDTRFGTILEFLGKHSFPIYLAHVLGYAGTRVCLVKGLGVIHPPIHIVAGIVGGITFPIVLLFLGNRYCSGFPFEFRLPMLVSRKKT